MKFSNLITKPIISLFESEIAGIIYDVVFSKNIKKIKSLVLESEISNGENDEYLLETKDVFKIGQDAIMIKNKSALKVLENKSESKNPLNFRVFTTSGQSLGKVSDLELDENFNVLYILSGENKFNLNQIASIKNGIILINTEEYYVNPAKFKPKTKPIQANSKPNQKAIILPIYDPIANNSPQLFENPFLNLPKLDETSETTSHQEAISNPIPRLNTPNQNLVGKTITHTIVAQNGELIAKQGCIVTENTLQLASSHQKLRELSFYAK